MNSNVYLYVFDTMSDWEIGYLTAELNSGRYFKKRVEPFKIVTVAIEKTPVTTMGGLTLMPDISLSELDLESIGALILPGGNTWLSPIHQAILEIARKCLAEGKLVAAICGATMGLAQTGLLDSLKHTSNDLEYLKMVCPTYKGVALYQQEVAVTDGALITASGIAPLEFSVHVLKALDVFSTETLEAWYQLNKTQEPQYFYQLMSSLS